ncbi:hypothetical protein NPIL_641181 [Nephila pilipes]|uniref:Uncharacterized protein n=1 Tax=Nephila pilipes TaxID=299642 RepID=A0A8X6UVA8_NEPPI|nr:hypothetical protein NPIL_641181 [Nephila pilipes]
MNHWRSSNGVSFESVRGEVSEWSCGGVAILMLDEAWRCDAGMKNFDLSVVNVSIDCLKKELRGLYIERSELVQYEFLMKTKFKYNF